MELQQEPTQGSGAPQVDLARVQEMLEEVLRSIDAHEIEATSPERAHIAGALAALRVLRETD